MSEKNRRIKHFIFTPLRTIRQVSMIDFILACLIFMSESEISLVLKLCNRCQRTIQYPNTYCENCQPVVKKEREKNQLVYKRRGYKKFYAKQDKKYIRFYQSPEWRMLSAKMMQERGYRCEVCKQIATQVHHVVAIQTDEGWERRFDVTNLKCLCGRCHNKAHNRFVSRK